MPQGQEGKGEGRPSRNQKQLLIGPDRVDLSRGAQEKQTIPCKRLIINKLLVLTTYRRQEGPFRPSTTGNQLGPVSVGRGTMRSCLALPLLLLLCVLLAEGKPDGRGKKGKPRPLGRGSSRAAPRGLEEGPAQTAPPPSFPGTRWLFRVRGNRRFPSREQERPWGADSAPECGREQQRHLSMKRERGRFIHGERARGRKEGSPASLPPPG